MRRLPRSLLYTFITFLTFIILLVVTTPWSLPWLTQHIVIPKIEEKLQTKITLDKMDFDLWSLSTKLSGFTLYVHQSTDPLISFESLNLKISSASLIKKALIVDEVTLKNPSIAIVRTDEQRYNFSWLLQLPKEPQKDESKPLAYSINNIAIINGKMTFDDRPKHAMHTIDQLTFLLPFISTIDYDSGKFLQPSFQARVDGAALRLEGQTRPFAKDQKTALSVSLKDIALSPLLTYIPLQEITALQGKLDTNLSLDFQRQSKIGQRTILTLGAHVTDFMTHYRNDNLSFSSLAIAQGVYDIARKSGHLEHLALQEPSWHNPTLGNLKLNKALLLRQAQITMSDHNLSIAHVALEGADYHHRSDHHTFDTLTLDNLRYNLKKRHLTLAQLGLSHTAIQLKTPTGSDYLMGSVGDVLIEGVDTNLSSLNLKNITLHDVHTKLKNQSHTLASFKALQVIEPRVDLSTRLATVGQVYLKDSSLTLRRDRDGNLSDLIPLRSAQKETPSPQTSQPWSYKIDKIDIDHHTLHIDDQSLIEPFKNDLVIQTLAIRSLASDKNALSSYQTVLKFDKGSLLSHGNFRQNGYANGDVDIAQFPLTWVKHVVSLPPRLDLRSAKGALKGHFSVNPSSSLDAKYQGKIAISDVDIFDRQTQERLMGFKNFSIGGITFASLPKTLTIKGVALNDFETTLKVDSQGKINWQDVLARPAAAVSEPATTEHNTSTPPTKPYDILIQAITLQNGHIFVEDGKVTPPYKAHLEKIGGHISALHIDHNETAILQLLGHINNYGKIAIDGNITPSSENFALHLMTQTSDIAMNQFDPYCGKYLGYKIESGNLGLDLGYHIVGKELNATNGIRLNQFELGSEVDSPTAVHLPLRFALSLLKDGNGNIQIDLPVEGTTDSPDFKSGKIVWTMIFSFLKKLITAPFAVLGSMFGGGEESGYIAFNPGSAKLLDEATPKLTTMGKLLSQRPGLALEIIGFADPQSDTEGLKKRAFDQKIKKQKQLTMIKNDHLPDLSTVMIEPDEYLKYLTLAYKAETFAKPKVAFFIEKSLPQEEMEKLMLTNIVIDDANLTALAKRRADAVSKRLSTEYGIDPKRLSTKTKVSSEKDEKRPSSRVQFDLMTTPSK